MEFDTDELVQLKGCDIIYTVVGVVHDDEDLYLLGPEDSREFKVDFSKVERRWANKEL